MSTPAPESEAVSRRLKLLSANIQAGSSTRRYSDYVTRSWSHALPAGNKRGSLDLIAQLAGEHDIVGLQEADPGSLRSGFTNQTHYLAEREGQVVGSVFVVHQDADTAKLRMLYVDATARGLGLGRRLVDEALRFATARGYRRMVLWTNDVLVSARRIYEAQGFELVEQDHHHSFGKDLVGQVWARDL